MAGDDRARAALDNFIAELNQVREAIGPYSYKEMRLLSKRLSDPAQTGVLRVQELAESTAQEILSGKRANLPAWPWVASFVAVCRVAASETGLDPDELGTVTEWKAKYQAARDAIRGVSRGRPPPGPALGPVRGAPADSSSAQPAAGAAAVEPAPTEPAPMEAAPPEEISPVEAARTQDRPGPGEWHEPPTRFGSQRPEEVPGRDRTPDTVPPVELTIARQRHVVDYGRTGIRLLRNAEEGNAEPAFRLAALLMCDDRPMEAMYWLHRAADAGHEQARELCCDVYYPYEYWRAADLAYAIGHEYEQAMLASSALVFYERAGKQGHAEASYRAGLNLVQLGRKWEAAACFSRAARNGHPGARQEYEALHRQLSSDVGPVLDPVRRSAQSSITEVPESDA